MANSCKVCGEAAEVFCQCVIPTPPRPVSPYDVPATSVVDAPRLAPADPLAPFEQAQVKMLVNQFNAASCRVREAVLAQVVPPALSAGIPKVVRFRG